MIDVITQAVHITTGEFPSSFDPVALLGIVGTLLGAALGALITWRVQRAQLDHLDRTRFHEHRLTVYAQFTASANAVLMSVRVGALDTTATGAVIRDWEILRLVATKPVVQAAFKVHTQVGEALGGVTDVNAFAVTFNDNLGALVAAMRREIGVDTQAS